MRMQTVEYQVVHSVTVITLKPNNKRCCIFLTGRPMKTEYSKSA